jgi:RHS repeat-associated protein
VIQVIEDPGDGTLVLQAHEECQATFYAGDYYELQYKQVDGGGCDLDYGLSYYYINGQSVAAKVAEGGGPLGDIYYLHRDNLGSLVEVTDENGNVKKSGGYDAFGDPVQGDFDQIPISRSYLGQLYDADIGLYKIGTRWYDPEVALYLQPDPFGGAPEAPASLNRYAMPGMSTFTTLGSVPGSRQNYVDLVVNWSEVNSALNSNVGKAGLGLIVANALEPRLLKASQVERLVKESILRRVPKYAHLEKMVGVGFGTLGVLQSRIGDNALFHASDRFLAWLYELNTRWVEEARWVPKMVPSDAPLGRLAGWLAEDRWGVPAPKLDLGVGLVIDVGIQGASDFGMLRRGELTLPQYGGRLAVEAGGSFAAWGAGTFVVVALGFSAPVGFAVAAVTSTVFDLFGKQPLYDFFGLNPRS